MVVQSGGDRIGYVIWFWLGCRMWEGALLPLVESSES